MNKKVLSAMLVPVCAFCCAFSLTGCTDDGELQKYHTAEQWEQAFADASIRNVFHFSDSTTTDDGATESGYRVEYDKNIGYYDYYNYSQESANKTIFTIDGYRYLMSKVQERNYEGELVWQNTPLYEITAEKEAEVIKENGALDLVNRLLDLCKDKYDSCRMSGWSSSVGTSFEDAEHFNYSMTGVSFELDAQHQYVFENLEVSLNKADSSLHQINITFSNGKRKYNYEHRTSLRGESGSYTRDRIEGRTYKLSNIYVNDYPNENAAIIESWKERVLTANADKTITTKAGGKIEGGIEIELPDGSQQPINEMTYTENYKAGQDPVKYGEVTVTNGLDGAENVTLKGDMAGGFELVGNGDKDETDLKKELRLTMNMGQTEYIFTFQVVESK